MALNTQGFVTPENKFEGLNQAAETIERKNYRDEQARLREEERQQQREAKRSASSRFFANYLDPKDRFTGTNYDPETYKILDEALSQAYDLAGKGLGDTDILAAINPLINKANQYTQSAKVYNQRKKDFLDNLKVKKGFNLDAVSRAIDESTFFNEDGTKKDITQVDPDLLPEYIDRAFKSKTGLVEPMGNMPELLRKNDLVEGEGIVKNINSRGGIEKTRRKYKMYDWMQLDNEGEFAPKYEHATDGDEYVKYGFANKDKESKVRLLDKNVFNNIIKDDPAYHQYIMEELRKAGYNGDFKNDEKSYNAARALAYMDAAQYQKHYLLSDVENKQAPIKIYNNYGSTNDLNNIYERIKQKGLQRVSDYKSGNYFDNSLESQDLNADELEVVSKVGSNYGLSPDEIKVIVEDNGRIGVYNKGDGKRLAYLNQTGVNLQKQANVAGKRASVAKGNEPFNPVTTENIKSKTDTYTYEGITGTYEQLVEAVGKSEADKLIKSGKAKKN